jgi:hypothetical protein
MASSPPPPSGKSLREDLPHAIQISDPQHYTPPLKSPLRRPSLRPPPPKFTELTPASSINPPPSFAESQFATIVRRQRPRDTALKVSNVPTRYPNLPRDFEFAGYILREKVG